MSIPRSPERSAGERIYLILKEEIIQGELAQGAKVSERSLAERFETSRIPLRDAVQRLIAEGFMTSDTRRGTMVTTIRPRDLDELWDVRESLEVMAARLAAERCDAEGRKLLRSRIKAARVALAKGDDREVVRANAAFHEAVIDVADNELLRSVMVPLNDKIRWVFGAYLARPLDQLVAEHAALYELIVSGDSEAIRKAAYVHVREGRERRAGH